MAVLVMTIFAWVMITLIKEYIEKVRRWSEDKKNDVEA